MHIRKELLMKNISDEHKNIILHRYHQTITNYDLLAYLIYQKNQNNHKKPTNRQTPLRNNADDT